MFLRCFVLIEQEIITERNETKFDNILLQKEESAERNFSLKKITKEYIIFYELYINRFFIILFQKGSNISS